MWLDYAVVRFVGRRVFTGSCLLVADCVLQGVTWFVRLLYVVVVHVKVFNRLWYLIA